MLSLRLVFAVGALGLVGCATAGESELGGAPDGPGQRPEPTDANVVDASSGSETTSLDAAVPPDARTAPDARLPVDAGITEGAEDICATAPDITAAALMPGGVMLTGTTAGYANDLEMTDACTGWTTPGPDAIFAVQLGFAQAVVATATPMSPWDVSVMIVEPCDAAPSCLNGADDGLDGEPETASHLTFLPSTIYVVVDGYTAMASGPYSLNVQIR